MTMITPYGVVAVVVVVVVVLTMFNEESTHTNAFLLERKEDHRYILLSSCISANVIIFQLDFKRKIVFF